MNKKTVGRIALPKNVEEMLDLGQKVYNKHLADGTSSPLNALQDHDWAVIGPKIQQVLQKHKEAEEYRRRAEEAYKERDITLPQINEILRASGAVLKAINAKNPKRLGEWGFEVDDSPKVKK